MNRILSRIIQYLYELLIKLVFANCLRALVQLQHAYFACYIKRDYLSNQSNYEKSIYQKRSIGLKRMAYARSLLKKNKNSSTKWTDLFSKITHLSEIIFSLNQLRFRVTDYAIFEICALEMQALDRASAAALKAAVKNLLWNKNPTYPVELLEAIHAFEAISHRVLNVASSEPIIFLFFIQDLYALYDNLYEKIN